MLCSVEWSDVRSSAMQNPSGGPCTPRPARQGSWARSSRVKQNRGSRKTNDARNMNRRWTPMGPQPTHGGYPQRFSDPPYYKDRWQGERSNRPDYSRPWERHPTMGETTPFASPSAFTRLGMPPGQESHNGLTSPNSRVPFPRPFPPRQAPHSSARSTVPNSVTTPKPESPKRGPPDKNTLAPNIPPLTLNSSLPTFDLQAQNLVHQCLLSHGRRRAVDMVISDVQQLLRLVLPDNVPIVYGSMATGLAWETSDIDCFIDSKSVPDGKERVKLLIEKYKVFYRRGTFRNVTRIPSARVPLVKAVHTRTGIEIDITCTSEGALYNTKLVDYLVRTDERIRPLVVLTSLCYRLNGLSGTHRFVSYTQVLLMVFYLQNLEVPMLPPLWKIIHFRGDEPWPVDFTRDVQNHLQAPNGSSLAELFFGFFKFYDAFDFAKNVVSTYLGRPIPVECFGVPDKLPDELAHLKEYYNEDPSRRNNFLDKFICVQDPMEHFVNTTSYVQLKTLAHFKKTVSHVVEIMGSDPETSWLDRVLKMAEEMPILDLPKHNSKPNPNTEFSVSCPKEESVSQDEWLSRLRKDLLAVFKLLLFDTVEVTKEPEAKVRIAEGPVHNRALMTFELKTFFNVFTKRFKNLPAAVIENPSLFHGAEKEMSRISAQMKKPTSSFQCELAVKQPVSPEGIPIVIKDINDSAANTYQHVAQMLREKLTGLLASARKSDVPEEPKDGNEQNPDNISDLLVQKRRNPCTKFMVSYKKLETEEEDAWKVRFKTDLVSLFDFLLLEHSDVTSECANTEILADGESLLFAFQLYTPYNVFAKRFKNTYNRVIDDPSAIPTVKSENAALCSDVNILTTGTFRSELLMIRSDCLSPDQVFVKICDINQNVRNNFTHYSSNLQLNFTGLLSSVKTFREMQQKETDDDKQFIIEHK